VTDLWAALALVLVIEGLLPFLSPRGYKQSMLKMTEISDRDLRIMGLISMVLGVVFLYLVRA
jgi:uncharacterized protein YjeT (DUF2065 family)